MPEPSWRHRARRAGWWVLLAAVIGVGSWHGHRRVPANPVKMPVVHDAAAPGTGATGTLRLATFNIHGGKGTDGRVDLERTAAQLRDVDLAVLHEVDGAFFGRRNQADVIGESLGLAWLFAPTERRWWHDHYGNALLTRVSLDGVQQMALPGTQRKKFRNAVLTRVRLDDEIVHVLATHLDRVTDRAAQLELMIDLFRALRPPAILIGDLNTRSTDPQLRDLLATEGVTDAAVVAESAPQDRVDWIIVKGLRPVSASYVTSDASDHPVVRAELELVKR